ncbi:MAG: sugar transferase [Oscillospiraceae bacterium]|nr:sugar transferase [Oscillospiraceae bacterium]
MNGNRDTAPMMERDTILERSRSYWRIRRLQDILLSVLAIAVLWPFMLLIALIIVIDSPGASPIFSQTRIGRDGKEFTFYKFRSMVPNAESKLEELLPENEMCGPVFKIRDDPRITRVGRFIRKCSIDELPQLFNVLRGDMSIVGPRPALPREVEQYDAYAMQRLIVSPGLTCYWQIQPNRNRLSFDEWLELDIKYIRERSFLTDWKIILATFATVLGMTGE